MEPVFDPPMTAVQFEQSRRISLFASERCDPISHFRRCLDHSSLTIARGPTASDTERLLDAGPPELLEELVQRDRAFQRALFAATMSFIPGGMDLAFRLPFTPAVGGKMPRFLR